MTELVTLQNELRERSRAVHINDSNGTKKLLIEAANVIDSLIEGEEGDGERENETRFLIRKLGRLTYTWNANNGGVFLTQNQMTRCIGVADSPEKAISAIYGDYSQY